MISNYFFKIKFLKVVNKAEVKQPNMAFTNNILLIKYALGCLP